MRKPPIASMQGSPVDVGWAHNEETIPHGYGMVGEAAKFGVRWLGLGLLGRMARGAVSAPPVAPTLGFGPGAPPALWHHYNPSPSNSWSGIFTTDAAIGLGIVVGVRGLKKLMQAPSEERRVPGEYVDDSAIERPLAGELLRSRRGQLSAEDPPGDTQPHLLESREQLPQDASIDNWPPAGPPSPPVPPGPWPWDAGDLI